MKHQKGRIAVDRHPGRIGCSQIAGALGIAEWSREEDVLHVFRGEPVPEPDEATRKRSLIGLLYEDDIAEYAQADLGVKVRRDTFAHWRDDMPELVCHPDRIIKGGYKGVGRVALEIKTASAYGDSWGDEWSDDIPTQYQLQCVGYVICGVADAVILAAERNHKVTYYWIHPSQETVDRVVAALKDWFAKAADPSYMARPRTAEEIAAIYPYPLVDTDMAADMDLYSKVVEWRQLKEDAANAKAAADVIGAQIMDAMQGHRRLMFGGNKVATIVQQKRRTMDTKRAVELHPELEGEDCWKETTSTFLR